MKNSVKFLIFAMLFANCFTTLAQTSGIRAGFNLSNIREVIDGENENEYYKINPGFLLGWMIDVNVLNGLSIQSGVDISQKGYKYDVDEDWNGSTSLLYAVVPATAKYTFNLEDVKIYGITGPYVGIGAFGWYKSEFEGKEESDFLLFGSDEDFKVLDIGFKLGAGLIISNIDIGVYYDLGLTNIDVDGDDDWKRMNRTFGITLGYWFGGND